MIKNNKIIKILYNKLENNNKRIKYKDYRQLEIIIQCHIIKERKLLVQLIKLEMLLFVVVQNKNKMLMIR